jgi:hypothetical protein
VSPNVQQVGLTVARESEDSETCGGVGLSSRPISSEASSSISVVSVPFDVTGDGPTISLGLVNCRPLGESPSSIAAIDAIEDIEAIADLGRSDDDSAEVRADLSHSIY